MEKIESLSTQERFGKDSLSNAPVMRRYNSGANGSDPYIGVHTDGFVYVGI